VGRASQWTRKWARAKGALTAEINPFDPGAFARREEPEGESFIIPSVPIFQLEKSSQFVCSVQDQEHILGVLWPLFLGCKFQLGLQRLESRVGRILQG